MKYYNILARRTFFIPALLTVIFASFSLQAEEFYVVDSYGYGRYSTPEQIDATFSAVVQTSTGWRSVDRDAIWKNSDKSRVFIYIHGNLTKRHYAIKGGCTVRQRLNQVIPNRDYKLVVWFWNSALNGSPLRQGSLNALNRSEWECFYLARFLQTAPENAEIRLIGYSFGANLAVGACHLLAGGAIHGKTSPGSSGNIQSLLIGPAIPTYAFVCGKEKALEGQVRCWVTVNYVDSGLRWYRLITPNKQIVAMGRGGVAGVPASQKEKLVIYEVTNQVGATHKFTVYLDCTRIFVDFASQ